MYALRWIDEVWSSMPMSIRLRPATQDDAHAVTQVMVQSRHAFLPFAPMAHSESEVLGWIANHLIPSGGVTVALHGDRVIALMATSHDGQFSWIDQMYVLPGYENQRVGSLLIKHAHAVLSRPIRLYTFQANAGARRFYERFDYQAIEFTDGAGNEEQCPDVLYDLTA